MDDAGVREIREHYRGEIATLRAEVDRLLNANRIMCDNYNAQDKLLTDEMKEVARLTAQLAAVTRERDGWKETALMENQNANHWQNNDTELRAQRDAALARVTALEEAGEAMRLDFGNPQTHERWRRVRGGGHELGM